MITMLSDVLRCAVCARVPVASGCSTGYGRVTEFHALLPAGSLICFRCAGAFDLFKLRAFGNGRGVALYLTIDFTDAGGARRVGFGSPYVLFSGWVTNWPSTLRVRVLRGVRGEHNIAGHRYDIWFRIPGDPFVWHGTQYGEWTQLVRHAKRTKKRELRP